MKHGCVLVADSHSEMRGAILGILHELFDTVAMVADEASLMAAIPRVRPELVVLDLSLPVYGARNIAAQCGQLFPSLPIVVLSVHDECEAVAATMRTGTRGYVLKRTAATDLARAVEAVLAGGTFVSPDAGPQPD